MSSQKRTVTDNGVEVIFEFTDATINVGKSNMDELLDEKAQKYAVDGPGAIWFTTKSNAQPIDKAEDGGIGSTFYWELIGTIPLGTKTLYVWECAD